MVDLPWKRCAADVVYSDAAPLRPEELARAQPNAPRNWDHFVVYVRPMLKDDPEVLRFVLAHELAHVAFGQWASEEDCDRFAGHLLGLDHATFRRRITQYRTKLGLD